jgi:hypothetical protein
MVTMSIDTQAFCDFTPCGYLRSRRVTCLHNLSLLSPIRVTAYVLNLEAASSEFPLTVYSTIPIHIQEDLAFQTPTLLSNSVELNVPYNTILVQSIKMLNS